MKRLSWDVHRLVLALAAVMLGLSGCSTAPWQSDRDALAKEAAQAPYATPSPEGSHADLAVKLLSLAPSAESLDLSLQIFVEDACALALTRNPELRADLKRLQAKIERVAQVSSAPDPEIELALSYDGFFESLLGFMVEIMVPVIWPGKLDAAATEALHEAWEAWAELQARALEIREEVVAQAAELWAIDEELRLTAESLKSLAQLEGVARSRYEAQQANQQDVLRVKLQRLESENEGTRLRRRRREVEADFNSLLAQPPWSPVGRVLLPDSLASSAPLDSLYARAIKRRPEIAAMVHGLRAALAGLEMAELDYWPDLIPKIEIERDRDLASGMLRPSVAIPMTFLRPERREAAVAEARALLGARWHDFEAARIEVARHVVVNHARFLESQELFDRYTQELLPQARQTYEAALAGYRAGELDFLTAVSALIDVWELEKEGARLTAERVAAGEALRRAVGEAP